MTWTKLGDEFSDECANNGLPDTAFRTHVEAIGWLYRVENMDLRVPKNLVRRFAGSDNYEDGIRFLLSIGWWKEAGTSYEIVHHADVLRASITAQQNARKRSKKSSAKHRSKQEPVTDDVTGHADRQTDIQAVTPKESTNVASASESDSEPEWPSVRQPGEGASNPSPGACEVCEMGLDADGTCGWCREAKRRVGAA